MQIQLRAIWRDECEASMGMPLFFSPSHDVDAISVTANETQGFTTLTNIINKYQWGHTHRNLIDKTTKKSNEINQVGILNFLEPSLLLVPKTRGDHTDPLLITDLLLACDQLKVKTLHFSHYSFLNGLFPTDEIKTCLKVMLNPVVNTSVERVIWDIDKRFHRNMSLVLNRYLKYYGDLYPNEFKSNNDNLKDLEVNRGLQYESDEWEEDDNSYYYNKVDIEWDKEHLDRMKGEKLYLLAELRYAKNDFSIKCRRSNYHDLYKNYEKLNDYIQEITQADSEIDSYLRKIRSLRYELSEIDRYIEKINSEIKENS